MNDREITLYSVSKIGIPRFNELQYHFFIEKGQKNKQRSIKRILGAVTPNRLKNNNKNLLRLQMCL
jgi:hypothetical protein